MFSVASAMARSSIALVRVTWMVRISPSSAFICAESLAGGGGNSSSRLISLLSEYGFASSACSSAGEKAVSAMKARTAMNLRIGFSLCQERLSAVSRR